MALNIYKSTDASAPTLSAALGSLTNILSKCLVEGYGSKSPAGWTKDYTATNAASFRNSPTAGTGMYVWVDHSVYTASTFFHGYETMSGADQGTGRFPTSSTEVYLQIPSSVTAWWCFADNKRFYFIVEGVAANTVDGMFFGDFISYKTGGDAYSTAIFGQGVNSTGPNYLRFAYRDYSTDGHYVARSYTGIGQGVAFKNVTNLGLDSGAAVFGGSGMPYPNGPDGGLYVQPIYVYEGGLRGKLPGMWSPSHNRPVGHKDIFSGSGAMAGRTFLALNTAAAGTNGQIFIETSDTWES